MPLRTLNNTFTRGELDPTLFARSELDFYSKGARRLRNMITLWTGAARIAPGTSYIDTIVDREDSDVPITDSSKVFAFDFLYDSDENYLYTIVIRDSKTVTSPNTQIAFDIYYDDTLQTTVISTDYTAAQIPDLYIVKGQDRVLVLHPDVAPKALRVVSIHTSWSLSDVTFVNKPTFDYSVIQEATDYSTFTFTLGATTGTSVSLTSSSAVFTKNHEGGLFISSGTARITSVTNATTATVRILDDFTSTSIPGNLASLSEIMWGVVSGTPTATDRGYPARGVFYLSRLMLGRSPFLKNLVAVSTDGVFNDFDDSTIDAVSSFSVSFNGKGQQSIQSMVADDSIIFLTSGKIFAQSPLVETPLTAENVYFAPQSENPSSTIEAVTIDNQILYINDNQSQVMQAAYITDAAKYVGIPAGILSNHLFETLTSNASWDPSNISTRLYMATQANGTMLFYSTLLEQQVAGWTLRTTRGNFKQVLGDNKQAHVVVERQINLGNSTFETSIDYAYLSDSTFKAFYDIQETIESAAGSTIAVLEDENDYIVLGNEVPFTALDVTLDTNASSDVGLVFEYLDNNGFWDVFTPTDNTTGLTGSGSITWDFSDVLNWAPQDVNDVQSMYWIRLKRTTETVTTDATIEQIEVNTGVRLYLEKLSFDRYTDSTSDEISDANGDITGLEHLAGQQVYAINNGATTGPYFVNASGELTIDDASSLVAVGLQYIPELVPMPLYTPTQEGDNTYQQKYVQDLYIDYVDSLYLKAGTGDKLTDIPNMKLNNYTLGSVVSPQTGIFKINPRGNWEPRQEFSVTQSQPGPMTIIGVGYTVEVS